MHPCITLRVSSSVIPQGLPLLPQEAIPKLTERILRLQSLESNMVVQASLQTLRVRADGGGES
jgi:hypothetical protein